MKTIIFHLFLISFNFLFLTSNLYCNIPFLESESKSTATYDEAVSFFKELNDSSPFISMNLMGESDHGKPLHFVVFSYDSIHNPELWTDDKMVVLVMNAIHAGEPCGVDATMLLFDSLSKDETYREQFKDIILVNIPIYNVGGAINRSPYSRANQKGPIAYGFRGNALNFNLNRDFSKADTKNTKSFYSLYHLLKPDIFIDTHTSDGADYQHKITLLANVYDKLGSFGNFLRNEFDPLVYSQMNDKKDPLVPYVMMKTRNIDDGLIAYDDSPRYSIGYTTLFNTISYTSEAHMLKSFEERVYSTKNLIESICFAASKNKKKIIDLKNKNILDNIEKEYITVNWELDTNKFDSIEFMGYEQSSIKSELTGADRMFFDHDKPYTKEIKFYSYYSPSDSIKVPDFYLIPKKLKTVLELFRLSDIEMIQLTNDTTFTCEDIMIEDYKSLEGPWEGHYYHYNVVSSNSQLKYQARSGDYLVPTKQEGIRYIISMLEPESKDSFFAWNFFDTYLSQLEYFSSYVFEEKAKEFLDNNPELRTEFLEKKMIDKEFASNPRKQLDYIYRHSPYFEGSYKRMPYFRVIN